MANVVTYLLSLSLCLSVINGESKKSQILAKIFKVYDESVLPTVDETDDNGDGPVVVSVNLHLRRIEVNDFEQEHTVQVTFRQFWTDKRLAYENEDDGEKVPQFIIVDQDKPEYKIWKPDTFFPNDVEDDNDDSGHADSVVKISPKGEVIFSQRFTSTFACPMNADEYPFDEQKCTMDIASYGFTSNDVIYKWQENPITLKPGLNRSISGYELTHYNTSHCTTQTKSGDYSCLTVTLFFDRVHSLETHKIFGYSIALVIASWIPFWLRPFDTAARAIIGVALLATTIVFNHLVLDESIIENVSYTTPVHVWTDATLGFVFLALVQLAFVVLLSPRNVPCVAVGVGHEHGETLIKRKATDEDNEKIFSVPFKEYHWGKRFDIICRILFPLVYGIFNIVFWSIYSD